MIDRRHLLAAGLAGLGGASVAAAARPASPAEAALVTHTFIAALPGRRAQLRRFLELNWLAMDRRAIDAGLFTHATLFEVASGEGQGDAPDFVMAVGYRTPGGYGDVEARFREIRRQHRIVLVDGLDLSGLGRIVGEQQLRPAASA